MKRGEFNRRLGWMKKGSLTADYADFRRFRQILGLDVG
jgi:hypothetical protein